MNNTKDPDDDFALSGLPEDVATQAKLGEVQEEISDERSEEIAPSEASLEEMEKESDEFMRGEEWRSEDDDELLIGDDEDTEESMPEESMSEEDAGMSARRGRSAGLFDKYKTYLIAVAVLAILGGWQWYQKHHLRALETPPASLSPSPIIMPQADPLSPEKLLPAAQETQKSLFPPPGRPSAAALDDAPKPQAAVAPVIPHHPKPEQSPTSSPSQEERMRNERIDALQERIVDLEEEMDGLKRKLRGLSVLSGRADIQRELVRDLPQKPPKKPAAAPKKQEKKQEKKPAKKKQEKKSVKKKAKRTSPFALLGTYMDEQGQWVAQVLIGGAVYEMRAGEKHRGIRVQRVDGKGVVINGRHY